MSRWEGNEEVGLDLQSVEAAAVDEHRHLHAIASLDLSVTYPVTFYTTGAQG